jgi:hypothetical protein
MFGLRNPEKDMLNRLALGGPEIGNHMKPDIKNPSRASRNLKEKKLITGEYTDQFSRPSEILSLTKKGLVIVLRQDWDIDDITAISSHWGDMLPLVLGKWDFFLQEGWANWVRDRIHDASLSAIVVLAGLMDTSQGRRKALKSGLLMPLAFWAEQENGARIEDTFTKIVYGLGIGKTVKAQKFLEDCEKNPAIRKYLLSMAQKNDRVTRLFLKHNQERLEVLQDNKQE